MTPSLPSYPDAEGAVRTWLRAANLNAGVNADATGKVFFAVPKDGVANFPMVVMRRVAGAPHPELPVDASHIQFDVWSPKKFGKSAPAAIAYKLAALCNNLPCGTPMGTAATALGAEVVLGPVWRPDTKADLPRYVVDVVFQLRPSS